MEYISQFLSKDLGFTEADQELVQEEVQYEFESKVSRAVRHKATVIQKKTG